MAQAGARESRVSATRVRLASLLARRVCLLREGALSRAQPNANARHPKFPPFIHVHLKSWCFDKIAGCGIGALPNGDRCPHRAGPRRQNTGPLVGRACVSSTCSLNCVGFHTEFGCPEAVFNFVPAISSMTQYSYLTVLLLVRAHRPHPYATCGDPHCVSAGVPPPPPRHSALCGEVLETRRVCWIFAVHHRLDSRACPLLSVPTLGSVRVNVET